MQESTSIRVPKHLRDRLAEHARRSRTTLAGALEQALDQAEAQDFWAAVRADHSRSAAPVPPGEQSGSHALRDNLADVDDDALGRDGW